MNLIRKRLIKKSIMERFAIILDDLKVYPDLKKYFRTEEKAKEERYDENGNYHQELDWWYTPTDESEKFYVYKMYGPGVNKPLFGYMELFQMTKNTQDKDMICFLSLCSDNGEIGNVFGYEIFHDINANDLIKKIKSSSGISINGTTFLAGDKIYTDFSKLKKYVYDDIAKRNKKITNYLQKL